MSRCPVAVLAATFATLVLAPGGVACGGHAAAMPHQATPPSPGPSANRLTAGTTVSRHLLVTGFLASQTRTAKADLIQRSAAPPEIVIFGGSRALRFDPAYVQRLTGLRSFNAAVTQARATDTWALLNLLRARFPSSRFRFLWLLHADQFDRRPIDPAILMNPVLARYFPATLVASRLPAALTLAARRQTAVTTGILRRSKLVYAPNGYVVSGFFSNRTPPPAGHVRAVAANIRSQLALYRRSGVRLAARAIDWFKKDLRLMGSLAASPPVIVVAPFDRRIYDATVHRGWGARHRALLRLLTRLRRAHHFSFVDLSDSTAYGFTARDFYDGVHLTRRGGQKVIDLVLERFPRWLEDGRPRGMEPATAFTASEL